MAGWGAVHSSAGEEYVDGGVSFQTESWTTDSAGNTYVVGSRTQGGTLTVGIVGASTAPAIYPSYYGGSDVFITKLDPNGQFSAGLSLVTKRVRSYVLVARTPAGRGLLAGASPPLRLSM